MDLFPQHSWQKYLAVQTAVSVKIVPPTAVSNSWFLLKSQDCYNEEQGWLWEAGAGCEKGIGGPTLQHETQGREDMNTRCQECHNPSPFILLIMAPCHGSHKVKNSGSGFCGTPGTPPEHPYFQTLLPVYLPYLPDKVLSVGHLEVGLDVPV